MTNFEPPFSHHWGMALPANETPPLHAGCCAQGRGGASRKSSEFDLEFDEETQAGELAKDNTGEGESIWTTREVRLLGFVFCFIFSPTVQVCLVGPSRAVCSTSLARRAHGVAHIVIRLAIIRSINKILNSLGTASESGKSHPHWVKLLRMRLSPLRRMQCDLGEYLGLTEGEGM
jgi:hypothetical protein